MWALLLCCLASCGFCEPWGGGVKQDCTYIKEWIHSLESLWRQLQLSSGVSVVRQIAVSTIDIDTRSIWDHRDAGR